MVVGSAMIGRLGYHDQSEDARMLMMIFGHAIFLVMMAIGFFMIFSVFIITVASFILMMVFTDNSLSADIPQTAFS
jgi:hypothetical protein